MELTPGAGRVSLTVSDVLPTRLQLLVRSGLIIDFYRHRSGAQSWSESSEHALSGGKWDGESCAVTGGSTGLSDASAVADEVDYRQAKA